MGISINSACTSGFSMEFLNLVWFALPATPISSDIDVSAAQVRSTSTWSPLSPNLVPCLSTYHPVLPGAPQNQSNRSTSPSGRVCLPPLDDIRDIAPATDECLPVVKIELWRTCDSLDLDSSAHKKPHSAGENRTLYKLDRIRDILIMNPGFARPISHFSRILTAITQLFHDKHDLQGSFGGAAR